ncbi:hypothetical protein LUZ60_008376 [Juncus effusus]|nr:hypothetical protein LUZ60_008376 [Juncus effusus]
MASPPSPSPSPLLLFLSLLLLSLLPSSLSQQTLIPSERQTLLQIKQDLQNPPGLSSWTNISSSYCTWTGVTCSPSGSVTQLVLYNLNITAIVPSSICNLKNLSYLDLSDNNIPGSFPAILSNCTNLQYLDLTDNYFNGSLPSNIDVLFPKMVDLNLSENIFAGEIPTGISRIISLQSLRLDNNNFSGTIPIFISELINLQYLTLGYNFFSPGEIPTEYSKLVNLTYIFMASDNLYGEIPESLMQLKMLNYLDLSMNNLNGTIPPSLWSLENLQILYLYNNKFSGEISFENGTLNAQGLERIDLSTNQLTGLIPESFGTLKNLSVLYLYYNNLTGEIPENIGLLTKLTDLRIFNNKLTGVLPPELGKNSLLWSLEADDNMLTGQIPKYICEMQSFTFISVSNNNMNGTIPQSLANCTHLDGIQIQNNQFSGEVPIGLWNSQNVTTVLMSNNFLSGELPSNLPWNITRVEIENNQFGGNVPVSASNLQVFLAGNNNFSGELSPEFPSGMPHLQQLNLSSSQISGQIPTTIGSLTSLNTLDLSSNHLSGEIPASLGSIPVLTTLDLSANLLSGGIPASIGNLKPNYLNLSSNDLSGEIPAGIDLRAYNESFSSNPSLCSSSVRMNGVKSCGAKSNGSDGISHGLRTLLIVLGTVLFVIILLFGVIVLRDYNRRKDGSDLATWKLTSFQSLDFNENVVVRGLKEENFIGSGGTGRVYRVCIDNRAGEIVAVKKIYNAGKVDLKLEKDFESEVRILGSIRHVNIVKLLCCVSSPDSKLLVYEYMEKSSLDTWLHGNKRALNGPLDWATRLEIAIGAARGLCYMHHECVPAIVHRDVKSSNILLEKEFKAKIADFGLARILARPDVPNTVSVVAGSFGYMAPECAYARKVNEKVDVYSFGVVLLELTTGRTANDGGAQNNLAELAWHHVQQGNLIYDLIEKDLRNPAYLDEIEVVFKLGLICTNALPSNRPTMKEVLDVLLKYDIFNQRGGEKKRFTDYNAAPLLNGKNGSRKKGSDDENDCEGLVCNV